jgi:DNA replicative helicase MCM subunit Mcm2 (Cdc46/Mcm family)
VLAVPEYMKKIEEMMANDTTTLYCDFNHLLLYDQTLAEAIELNFYRYIEISMKFLTL